MNVERKAEIWAIAVEQAEQFLREQPDVTAGEEGYRFGACRISVAQLPPRTLGSLSLPQTKAVFEGSAEDLRVIYSRFFYRFLSGGA